MNPLTIFVSSLACATLLMPTPATAQTTWLVDALNGPGANFTDLPAAVAAANSGDVILVVAYAPAVATYQGATITSGLTVVGTPAPVGGATHAAITGQLRVLNLAASERVALGNLLLGPFPIAASDCLLEVRDCTGAVHLQEVDRNPVPATSGPGNRWRIERCGLVTMSGCDSLSVAAGEPPHILDTEHCVMTDCSFNTVVVPPPFALPDTFLEVTRSTMTLLDCTLVAPLAIPTGYPTVRICDTTVNLVGSTTVTSTGQAGSFSPLCFPSTNAIHVGPGVTVSQIVGIAPSFGAISTAFGATLDAAGQLTLRVSGTPLGQAAFALGAPAPTPLPLLGSLLFLQPGTIAVFASTTLNGDGLGTWSTTLPATLPPGIDQWFQAAIVGTSSFELTPPARVVTR